MPSGPPMPPMEIPGLPEMPDDNNINDNSNSNKREIENSDDTIPNKVPKLDHNAIKNLVAENKSNFLNNREEPKITPDTEYISFNNGPPLPPEDLGQENSTEDMDDDNDDDGENGPPMPPVNFPMDSIKPETSFQEVESVEKLEDRGEKVPTAEESFFVAKKKTFQPLKPIKIGGINLSTSKIKGKVHSAFMDEEENQRKKVFNN